jgi:ATP-dependent DNA helicase RecQ
MILEKVLYDVFGYKEFRTGQKEIITSVLKNLDTVGILPTGTGKSLCYQFIGQVTDGQIIIVSPLLSLMQDQVEQMKAKGEKRVIAINSFLTPYQKNIVFQTLSKYKYIFISPEMLQMDTILQKIRQLKISLFVIDEAHCISQWGYDFRTDYFKLGEVRKQLNSPVTLALTATATKEVISDIINVLDLKQATIYETSVDRPNISLVVSVLEDTLAKQAAVLTYLKTLNGPGIIYFSSKKLAEQMVGFLKANAVKNVMAYHGGMTHEERILIQQQFLNGQIEYVCATSAFGMGINKENIRFVIHFHMPLQMESYLQEIGRAGRDGKESVAILLYARGDENLAIQLTEGELPSLIQLDWLLNEWNDRKFTKVMNILSEDLCQRGGFTENQWRVTKEFIASRMDSKPITTIIDEFKNFVRTRSKIKLKKIVEMVAYIKMDGCRRRSILEYFGESYRTKQKLNCCDNCGIDLKSYEKKIITSIIEEEIEDWTTMLTRLLTYQEGPKNNGKVLTNEE